MRETTLHIITIEDQHKLQETVHSLIYEKLKDDEASDVTLGVHRVLTLLNDTYEITAERKTELSRSPINYLDILPEILENRQARRLRPIIVAVYDFDNSFTEESRTSNMLALVELAATGHNVIVGTNSETLVNKLQEESVKQRVASEIISG